MANRRSAEERSAQFMQRVFSWMVLGLVLTSVASYLTLLNSSFQGLVFGNGLVFLVIVIAQLALVVVISWLIKRISAEVATALFLIYSFTMGITVSVIFLAYSTGTIALAFVSAAGMFAAMAVYGYVTKRDLTGLGSLLFMLLIGVIIAMVINMFLQSSAFDLIISWVGVAVFTGLTAYSTQRIKKMAAQLRAGSEDYQKASIIGALMLYLDFINLFLMLLRIFGGSSRE